MFCSLIAAVCLLLSPAVAVFSDEAWNVDYHYALLGESKQDTTFFHQPNPESRASLIYTLSKQGVLGAVNPRDGAVVWRHWLASGSPSPNASFLRAGEDQDVVVSGIGNQTAAWSAADGRLAWSVDAAGQVEDVELLGMSDGKATRGVKDALVLSGHPSPALQRLDGATGVVKWQYKIDGSDNPYQISASTTEIFVILLHKTILGNVKIRVLSLDPVDGRKTDEYTLSSDSELAGADNIISVGANSASPIIAWTDAVHTVLKVNLIGTKTIQSFNIEKHSDQSVERVEIHAPYHTNSLSHFLVHYSTATSHWADVFHVRLKYGKISKVYSLPKLAGSGVFATSTSDANVYFTRITSDEILTVSSMSHGILGRWPVAGFGVAAGVDEKVEPIRAVSELSVKADTISAIRTAVLLSTGDWVLLRAGQPVWQRPEHLAGIVSATFATPSEVEDFAQQLEREAHSNPIQAYIHRVIRHLDGLRHLPNLLLSLPNRILGGFLGTSADTDMAHDMFGFHKIIACATENGRVVALDAGNPQKILWNRKVADGVAAEASLEAVASGVLKLTHGSTVEEQFINASTGHLLSSARTENSLTSSSIHPMSDVQYTLHNGELQARKSGNSPTELWNFMPTPGEHIISLVSRPVQDPVASIGKVLGDRKVLYKYLSPNLALLTTANSATRTASFYVLDTISGAILHSNVHTGVDLNDPIASTMSENWFAYSFTVESSDSSPKGHNLVVGEMFESLVPNDRGPLNAASNFSTMHTGTEPFTLVHTYQIPEAISKMTVTQTRQGITSRQLLAVLADANAIVGIPYGALDPRRPVSRDPTKDEQAEGLVRYAPVIEFDPKWYLNHQRDVIGIKNIVTSPALIESTSILFAYGLDIFGTRLSPSFRFDILGKDFNKFQMLATVAALAVATFVVAPLVMRKQVNTRWQFT